MFNGILPHIQKQLNRVHNYLQERLLGEVQSTRSVFTLLKLRQKALEPERIRYEELEGPLLECHCGPSMPQTDVSPNTSLFTP